MSCPRRVLQVNQSISLGCQLRQRYDRKLGSDMYILLEAKRLRTTSAVDSLSGLEQGFTCVTRGCYKNLNNVERLCLRAISGSMGTVNSHFDSVNSLNVSAARGIQKAEQYTRPYDIHVCASLLGITKYPINIPRSWIHPKRLKYETMSMSTWVREPAPRIMV